MHVTKYILYFLQSTDAIEYDFCNHIQKKMVEEGYVTIDLLQTENLKLEQLYETNEVLNFFRQSIIICIVNI